MFRNIGIVAKRGDPRVRETLEVLIPFLRGHNARIFLDPHCADLVPEEALRSGTLAAGEPRDLVVVVGGDGTMLQAAQTLFDQNARLLGINLGRLGFLTDIVPAQITERLGAILDGHFVEEDRFFLSCTIQRGGKTVQEAAALNDVVVEKWNTARLISFDTYVDGRFVNSQRADGLIVATPTGSTAYALSGGGPILHPALDVIELVPICPHTLTYRPIVIHSRSVVEIVVTTSEPGLTHVTCDGESVGELAATDRVRIRRTDHRVRLIHPSGHDHYAVLRAKLHWGTDLC